MAYTNSDRAERAQAAIDAYCDHTGDVSDESHFRDLLSDLMHLAQREGAGEHSDGRRMTFPEALERAMSCFEDEGGKPFELPKPDPDGPYRPALAQAFREGARDLLQCNLGDKIDLPDRAQIEEGPDGGVYVHVRLFVSDSERQHMPGEPGAAD